MLCSVYHSKWHWKYLRIKTSKLSVLCRISTCTITCYGMSDLKTTLLIQPKCCYFGAFRRYFGCQTVSSAKVYNKFWMEQIWRNIVHIMNMNNFSSNIFPSICQLFEKIVLRQCRLLKSVVELIKDVKWNWMPSFLISTACDRGEPHFLASPYFQSLPNALLNMVNFEPCCMLQLY
jgi:hypothetical protein